MATVIQLPQDRSFGSGQALGDALGAIVGGRLQQQANERRKEEQQKALEAAFDPEASDSEVASSLAKANVSADVIAKIMFERDKASKQQKTYKSVTGYSTAEGPQSERQFFVPEAQLGDIDNFLAQQGYSLVKRPDAGKEGGETQTEREVTDYIKANGGDPTDPKLRVPATDLIKNRNSITKEIANQFNAKFLGEDFSFDTEQDRQRYELANAMMPRIMFYEGKERGVALKDATALAMQMIPEEESTIEDKTEPKEEGGGPISMLKKAFGLGDEEKKKPETQTLGKQGDIEIAASKEAVDAAQKGDTAKLLGELTKQLGSTNAAIKWLEENGYIEE